MRGGDLPVRLLQEMATRPVEHADRACRQRSRMPFLKPFAARFNADHRRLRVLIKRGKQADRIAPAADACDEAVRQPALLGENLPARFPSDDRLHVAHNRWIRMRSAGGAEKVVGRPNVRYPVPKGAVDGVL